MNLRRDRATKMVNIALKHAQNRMRKTSNGDQIAIEKEYKEWLNIDNFHDDIWFSTDRSSN